ncbi:MAG TPA: type II secretion system F family protein [Paraburkholderia sp.]|jgi:tight adherence protein B|nr:type II secretion system F family protein [Paraburkholderia sp.]
MDTSFIGFVVLLFIATVLMVEGLYLYWHGRHGAAAKRLKSRVRALSASAGDAVREPASILKSDRLSDASLTARLLLGMRRVEALQRLLVQAGLDWSIGRFVAYTGACAAAGWLAALVLHQPFVVGLLAGALCALLPWFAVRRKRTRRLALLEQQLPEAADLIARAMLAGHSFPSALGMVGDEMPQPLGGEFRLAFDEINFGASMSDALQNMVTRVPLDDLRYFVIAVLIQREAGGNLAEILGNISTIIRERLKLFGKVRVLSAEGRLSAWILCLMPFVLGGVISLINPGLVRVFWTDSAGMVLVGIALTFMLFGVLWSRSIVRIHV